MGYRCLFIMRKDLVRIPGGIYDNYNINGSFVKTICEARNIGGNHEQNF